MPNLQTAVKMLVAHSQPDHGFDFSAAPPVSGNDSTRARKATVAGVGGDAYVQVEQTKAFLRRCFERKPTPHNCEKKPGVVLSTRRKLSDGSCTTKRPQKMHKTTATQNGHHPTRQRIQCIGHYDLDKVLTPLTISINLLTRHRL